MKNLLLISAMMFAAFSAFAGKTYISVSNTTLTNINATDNGDGSVTFSLIDAEAIGTVRFDDINNFTPFQNVYFTYNQSAGNGVTYSLNNQSLSNARVTFKPASTLSGSRAFDKDIPTLITEGKDMGATLPCYFAVQLTSGTVTLSNIYCTDIINGTLFSQLDYSTNGTIAKAAVKSTATISGGSKQQIVGPNTTSATTYMDLSEFKGIQLDLAYPAANEGTELIIRFQFVSADGTATTTDADEYTIVKPTGSGTVTFSLENTQLPSKKLTGIKVWAATGVAFSLGVTDVYALKSSVPSSIKNISVDELPAFVNVYDINGKLIKKNVAKEEALNGLSKGIYIVNNKKMMVN